MLTDARLALLVCCLGTLSLLALTEHFAALPGAVIAFLAAHVVIGRAPESGQDGSGGRGGRHPALRNRP